MEYLNSHVVFKKYNPYELTWAEVFLDSEIRRDIIRTLFRNIPFFLLCATDILLRGIAQVFLCNHPVSGLLISLGLYYTSPQLFVFALVGCMGSTLSSHLIKESWQNVQSGLCGYV